MRIAICFLVSLVFYVEARSANYGLNELSDPNLGNSKLVKCHDLVCPADTTGCSKKTKTTTDRKMLEITIQCEDAAGQVLNRDTKTVDNPFPGTVISSFSYSSVHVVNFNGNTGYGNRQNEVKPAGGRNYYDHNDEIETFN